MGEQDLDYVIVLGETEHFFLPLGRLRKQVFRLSA
jgi:hypothetical protein